MTLKRGIDRRPGVSMRLGDEVLLGIVQTFLYSDAKHRPTNDDADVTLTYGRVGGEPNTVGRVTRIQDRTGSTEFDYDALGRTIREERSVGRWRTSGHSDVYVSSSTFDTWGRALQMRYPDGEVLTYSYDSGGRVRSAIGNRLGTEYPYVLHQEYDHFGAMVYQDLGNGIRSHVRLNSTDRRVEGLEAGDFQNMVISYDDAGQVTDFVNDVADRRQDRFGGRVNQHFEYDDLSRLTGATGQWNMPQGGVDAYTMNLAYDDLHRITHKTQNHQVSTRGSSLGGHPITQRETSYDWDYRYDPGRPHAPEQVGTATFTYDANGNQLTMDDRPAGRRRRTVWDEENLPRSMTVAGHETRFVYDAGLSRVAKIGAQGETVYVNPTWTVRNGSIATKHIYVGGSRVASKIVPGVQPAMDDPDLVAGMLGRWFEHRSDSGLEHGNNVNMNPHYRVASSMPHNGMPESNFTYFYHGDMSGSVSYVTDVDGEVYEHNQFFASGEQWVSQNSNSERLPFLFSGVELDQETGLYSFGVRTFDPRVQTWLSPDPALGMFLDGGDPNGGSVFQPRTLNLFAFAFNNPVMFEDPTGLYGEPSTSSEANMSLDPSDEAGAMTHDVGVEVVASNVESQSSPRTARDHSRSPSETTRMSPSSNATLLNQNSEGAGIALRAGDFVPESELSGESWLIRLTGPIDVDVSDSSFLGRWGNNIERNRSDAYIDRTLAYGIRATGFLTAPVPKVMVPPFRSTHVAGGTRLTSVASSATYVAGRAGLSPASRVAIRGASRAAGRVAAPLFYVQGTWDTGVVIWGAYDAAVNP